MLERLPNADAPNPGHVIISLQVTSSTSNQDSFPFFFPVIQKSKTGYEQLASFAIKERGQKIHILVNYGVGCDF